MDSLRAEWRGGFNFFIPSHLDADLIKEYLDLNSEVYSPNLSVDDIQEYLGAETKFKILTSIRQAFVTALQFCNVAKGDFVICQAFGPDVALDALVSLGAVPLLVDGEFNNWNISAVAVEMVINSCVLLHGTRPKAILVKHHMGFPAFMDEVCAVARRYQIPVVEDCVGAFGASFQGKVCGTMGQYAVYGVGGGTLDQKGPGLLIHRVPKFEAFLDRHIQHDKLEYKGKLPCSSSLGEMKKNLSRRKAVYLRYYEAFKNVSSLKTFQKDMPYIEPNYTCSPIVVKGAKAQEKKMAIVEEVCKAGIKGCCVIPPSLNRLPQFANLTFYASRVGAEISNNGLALPSHAALSDKEVEKIVEVVYKVMNV